MIAMTQELVDKVVELRRRTDAPAIVCRKALARCEWDLEKAKAHIEETRASYQGVLVTTREGRPFYGKA